MLNRSFMKCEACRKPFTFRIGVGRGDQQAFVFECPRCHAALHGVLHADQRQPRLRLESEDMVEIPERKANGWEEWPGVTVYTDLPVHVSCLGKSMLEGGSAFITLGKFMPEGAWRDYNERVAALHELRLQLLPALRRATAHFIAKDWVNVSKVLSAALVDQPHEIRARASFHFVSSTLFGPLFSETPWVDEVWALFRATAAARRPELEALRGIIDRTGFRQFRRQVVETLVRLFQKADALSSALAYERLRGVDAREFKIFRDDLDVLKSLYVDLFELASRALAYLGVVANLHLRGDPEQWANGKTRTLGKMLTANAVDREFILGEFPACASLYAGLNRHTRNDFGHCKVHYDFASGCLVDQDGKEENFLLFLLDLLGAARCAAFCLLLVRLLDEDPPAAGEVITPGAERSP